MANPTSFPGDIIVDGSIRTTEGFSPQMARSSVLEQAAMQEFAIPLILFGPENMKAGSPGILTGVGTKCQHHVSRDGELIKTTIFIDVTGLRSGTDVGDIIGVDGDTANCHIGRILKAVNGTIVHGRITCLETPLGGDPDIDFYGSVTEGTGVQDTPISDLTGETLLLNNGDWSAASVTPIAFTTMPGEGYLYMVDAADTDATYTAGQFLIELWGIDGGLTYVPGVHGTDSPSLQTADFGGNNTTDYFYARGEIALPWEYEAGETVGIRLSAGMLTTVSSVSCTVDLEVYKSGEDALIADGSSDLCTTEIAYDINNLVFADKDFTITSNGLNPGDILDVQITIAANDGAGDGGVMQGCIGAVKLLCDVR